MVRDKGRAAGKSDRQMTSRQAGRQEARQVGRYVGRYKCAVGTCIRVQAGTVGWQAGKQKHDRQTKSLTQTDRQICCRKADKQVSKTDRQAERQIDRQVTDRQTL